MQRENKGGNTPAPTPRQPQPVSGETQLLIALKCQQLHFKVAAPPKDDFQWECLHFHMKLYLRDSTFPVYLLFAKEKSAPFTICEGDAMIPDHAFKEVRHPWGHRQA